LKIWGFWGKGEKRDQLDQMASRAKELYLRSPWIVEDMSICRYIGISVHRYIYISLDSGGLLRIWGVWGKGGKRDQLDQMASRAKGLSLRSPWIVEDMSICGYMGISVQVFDF
jgi:hypothetical protein